jgi:hypothetical protein
MTGWFKLNIHAIAWAEFTHIVQPLTSFRLINQVQSAYEVLGEISIGLVLVKL